MLRQLNIFYEFMISQTGIRWKNQDVVHECFQGIFFIFEGGHL
jgi:hypothetical protein